MKLKKINKIIIFTLVLILAFTWGGVNLNEKIEWQMAEDLLAGSAFPVEPGIMTSIHIPCFTTGTPPVCAGGQTCSTKTVADCVLYTDVSGTLAVAINSELVPKDIILANAESYNQDTVELAQSMATNYLFSNINMGMAGLIPGADLIAGGMSPTMMDSGPLASWGGCANCVKSEGIIDKTKEKFKVFAAMLKK